MQRTYKLGQYLRRRYNHILGDRYSKNKVYVQSSDTDRTLMSAQSCLAGLFFPTEDEKWSNDILWRPVPVHTIPRKLDNVIAIERDETYVALHKKHCAESKEVKRIFTEYADHIAYWSKMSGINLSSLDRIHLLYDTFEIEKEQNKKCVNQIVNSDESYFVHFNCCIFDTRIPEWAEKAIEPGGIMEYISRFCYKLYSGTPKLVQISFGYLLNEMLEHFVQKASGTLKPDRVLWLYSAHDYSIFNALNGLGMLNEVIFMNLDRKLFHIFRINSYTFYFVKQLHIPPYASSLHFELYKRSDNSHYVQIFYRRSEEEHPPSMIIPGHGEKCSLDEFIDLCKPIIPDDIDAKSHL